MKSLHTNTSITKTHIGLSLRFSSSVFIFPVIFLFTFLFAFVSGSFFLSTGDTSAESSKVNIVTTAAATLAITTDASVGKLTIPITPSPTGAFTSRDLKVNVATNNITGYVLSMNTVGENTAMVNTSNPSYTLPSTANTVASPGTLGINTWGYSVWTSGQLTPSTTFSSLPPLSAPREITTTTAPSSSSITTLTFGTNVDTTIASGEYKNTIIFTATTNYVPIPPEIFQFTIDTRMTNTLDTDPAHYSGTATDFYIPTSGYVNLASSPYSWYVDCGGPSHTEQLIEGTSDVASSGILCSYPTAGEYQITIKSNGEPTMGWMDAFGFSENVAGANTQNNKNLFKSIDAPFTSNMRTAGGTRLFSNMFYGASNATTIPAGLFDAVNTSGSVTFQNMFAGTFNYFASNSITATIPAGLFDFLDTSSATNLSNMFSRTFDNFAYNSPIATIPANLFSKINTSGVASLNYMFAYMFNNFAFANKLGGTPDTDINAIWGSADLSGITATNANSALQNTFLNMPSLTGVAQAFISSKLSFAYPDSGAATFRGTSATDLASLHANWK